MRRLTRLDDAQVELALSLYRDTTLVKSVIASLGLDEVGEHIAISLAKGNAGPFLIVTRGGRFVTCLGRGMAPKVDTVVVHFSRLEAVRGRFAELHARADLAAAICEQRHQRLSDLVKRIFTAGDTLCREEFIAVAATQPFFVEKYFDQFTKQMKSTLFLQSALLSGSRRNSNSEASLAHHRGAHAVGHLALLSAMGDLGPIQERFRNTDPSQGPLLSCMILLGSSVLALRGAWVAARLGKTLLPQYKHEYATSSEPLMVCAAAMGLIAIAARNRRVRAEVMKFMDASTTGASPKGRLRRAIGALAVRQLHDLDNGSRDLLEVGRALYVDLTHALPASSPFRYAEAEVPDPLARTALLVAPTNVLNGGSDLGLSLVAAAAIGDARAEDFFWPEEIRRYVCGPLDQDRADEAFRESFKSVVHRPSQNEATRIGRNEPCPCNSGKKFKRCCA